MNLEQAIENLYAAFGNVPKPERIEGCPCCTKPSELAALVQIPLRLLTENELDKYAHKALTTIGTEQNLMYFTPRILELHAQDKLICSTEITFGKLSECPFSPEQWDAVADFVSAWWVKLIKAEEDRTQMLNEVLAAAQRFGFKWDVFLQIWDDSRSLNADFQLGRFVYYHAGYLDQARKFNAFLNEQAQPELDGLKSWLRREAVQERLERAFFFAPDEETAQCVSDALFYLEATA